MYPRLRPHRKQRLTTRDLYFSAFCDLAITDFFAIEARIIEIRVLKLKQARAGLDNASKKKEECQSCY